MLIPEQKNIIQFLTAKTKSGHINWQKDLKFNLGYTAVIEDKKILIDKYFAVDENQNTVSCLNISFFTIIDNKLLSEAVVCKVIEEQKSDYDLLETLYQQIESFLTSKNVEKNIPLFNSLLESIGKL